MLCGDSDGRGVLGFARRASIAGRLCRRISYESEGACSIVLQRALCASPCCCWRSLLAAPRVSRLVLVATITCCRRSACCARKSRSNNIIRRIASVVEQGTVLLLKIGVRHYRAMFADNIFGHKRKHSAVFCHHDLVEVTMYAVHPSSR